MKTASMPALVLYPLLFLGLLGNSPLLSQSSKTYSFFELAPLSGDASSAAISVNHNGQIVGYSANAEGRKRAVIWSLGSKPKSPLKPTALPDLGGGFSEAFDINDLGEIVGQASASNGQGRACLWNPAKAITDLSPLFGSKPSTALAINNYRDITGYKIVSGLQPSLLILRQGAVEDWSANQDMTRASDINNLRMAAGNEQGDSVNSAFFIEKDQAVELATPPNMPLAEVAALNMAGEMAGSCSSEDSQVAARWPNANQEPVLLGTLGGNYAKSLGLNSFGLIVGASNIPNSSGVSLGKPNNKGFVVSSNAPLVNELDHAFLWKPGSSSLSDLNKLTSPPKNSILQAATAINDFGEIAGYCNISGNLRGFVLLPSSRPSLALLAYLSRPEASYPKSEPVALWLSANTRPKEIRIKVDGKDYAKYPSIPYPIKISNLAPGSHSLEISVQDPSSKKRTVIWQKTVTIL